MGREVKKLWAFSRLDYKAAEQYLQKQAAKGYILKEINQFSLLWATYEKTEPKEIRYFKPYELYHVNGAADERHGCRFLCLIQDDRLVVHDYVVSSVALRDALLCKPHLYLQIGTAKQRGQRL